MQPLSKSQVHNWMSLLSDKQQEFIIKKTKQNKKSKWLEVLAKNKGISINKNNTSADLETIIDDWVLIEILDSGFGTRDYRCICGMPLRYQYVVMNKKKGEKVELGAKCFENHTNLSSKVVKDIIREFHKIDLVRDEILYKVANKQSFDINPYIHVDNLPPIILEQAELDLPLTDKQIHLLEQLKKSHDIKIQREQILSNLDVEARNVLEAFPPSIKDELVSKMLKNEYVMNLPDNFRDPEIEHFISLGFPLLDKQMERVFAYNRAIRIQIEEQKKREEQKYWLNNRKNSTIPNGNQTKDTSLDYTILIERHLTTFKKIREKENNLTKGMRNDWLKVQNIVRQSKKGEQIDYSSFKLNLSMICYSLKIEGDKYL